MGRLVKGSMGEWRRQRADETKRQDILRTDHHVNNELRITLSVSIFDLLKGALVLRFFCHGLCRCCVTTRF